MHDLVRRIKMLEFALKGERSVVTLSACSPWTDGQWGWGGGRERERITRKI